MKAVWTIAKRELFAFFVSPIAYVLLTVWLLITGASYFILCTFYAGQGIGAATESPLSAFFGGTTLFFIPLVVFVPIITMRLIAHEKQTGTLEALLTSPVSELSVVLGKYLAALLIWVTLWVPTLMYVWLTSNYGDVDPGAILSSYIGVFGIGLYYLAIGLLMSAIAPSQILAAILAFLVIGLLFFAGLGTFVASEDSTRQIFEYVSVWGHMEAFSRGIVDLRFVVYDLSLAVLGVFFAVQVLKLRHASNEGRIWSVTGWILVLCIAFMGNYIAYRHYARWDLTSERVFSLSDRSKSVLRELDREVEIYLFLSASEPNFREVRELLERYRAENQQIELHFVDPDRDRGRYATLAERFHLGSLATPDGAQVSDAAAVVASGTRTWTITRDDLVSANFGGMGEEGSEELNVDSERAITGALVELMTGEATRVCATRGHGEYGLSAGGDRSIAALQREMRRENLRLEEIDTRNQDAIDEGCSVVLVVGPEQAFTEEEAELLSRYVHHGGNLLLALDPVMRQERILPTGLERMLREIGVGLDRSVVLELSESHLPPGTTTPVGPFLVGEYGEHPITNPFVGSRIAAVMALARSVRPLDEESVKTLLLSSREGYAETDLGALIAEGEPTQDEADIGGPVPLAVAVQLPAPEGEEGQEEGDEADEAEDGDSGPRGGRVVVLGDADFLASEFIGVPEVANYALASAMIGWLSQRQALISIPPRTVAARSITLSQEDLNGLAFRVLVLMPLAFVFLGFGVWWSRRS